MGALAKDGIEKGDFQQERRKEKQWEEEGSDIV